MKSIEEHKEEVAIEEQKAMIEEATGKEVTVVTEKPKQTRLIHMVAGSIFILGAIFFINIPMVTYGLIGAFVISGMYLNRNSVEEK